MTPLEMWAGAECSVVRLGDRYVDQLELTGHSHRVEDLDALAALGVRAVRQPVLWERASDGRFADEPLARLRELGVRPIVGLVHHGSGPPYTGLLHASFVSGLAAFARSVAERHPWVRDFTPVNEPLTTARFSALYGHWYPHARSEQDFFRALIVECEAIRAAMKTIREVIPDARLVQTEDLGTVFSTPRLAHQARYENHRRFLSLDLLAGRVDERHPFHDVLVGAGVQKATLVSFVEDPCVPDVIGLNHYVTSDRFLDDRVASYPPHLHGGNGRDAYADVEAVRVLGCGIPGHRALLELLWTRYSRPLALTEVHLGCTPEEQVRWLDEAWRAAQAARTDGVDVRAVTVWSAFGAYDWDSLLTLERGHYEPGLFDVRDGRLRPTALASVARDLAVHGRSAHPMLEAPGWWRRRERICYPAVGRVTGVTAIRVRPVLITGAAGTLGRAVARVAAQRNLPVVALTRAQLDISDAAAVRAALREHRPWAMVNAAGYVRVDGAEHDEIACLRANEEGARVLAQACADRGVRLVTFSSDLVFDGEKRTPYVEADPVAPLSVYGASKAAAERLVLAHFADALVVRTSAFFGPWDCTNFIAWALAELRAGRPLRVTDATVSPTYVPDLAEATLTLLVDGMSGVVHLVNRGQTTWLELARTAAALAGIEDARVATHRSIDSGVLARRPRFSALASTRASLLPSLDDALRRFFVAIGVQGSVATKHGTGGDA